MYHWSRENTATNERHQMKIPFIVRYDGTRFMPLINSSEKEAYLQKVISYNEQELEKDAFWHSLQDQFLLNHVMTSVYIFQELKRLQSLVPAALASLFGDITLNYDGLVPIIKSKFSDSQALMIRPIHEEYIKFAKKINAYSEVSLDSFTGVDYKISKAMRDSYSSSLYDTNNKFRDFCIYFKNIAEPAKIEFRSCDIFEKKLLDLYRTHYPLMNIQLEKIVFKHTVSTKIEEKKAFKL